ncbi:MAG: hypothetical protein Q8Q08_04615 [Candidatus Omnitrophota bacterium]|nr:hypothetical protein [Candidatus Omnitrophota bacterium]MDZ4241358.1 hypothetical protein [Candidatus Omnitrophota bacterium]
MKKLHTFHIPVMGTGFSIDTPLKVAKYGISSVVSLVDDILIEDMRKYYSKLTGEEYVPITKDEPDYRARRITAYLNLMDRIVKKQFEELKQSAFEIGSEITKYFQLLPETSPLKELYRRMLHTADPAEKEYLQKTLRESIEPGAINVNIMTKLDRLNYDKDGKELPREFSDALAALRGFAMSTLNSAIVFSAGINRQLYSYVEEFKDFYADASGFIKKRVILKVSDFRSSIIQGKFFAKKGIWISEFRVESGLNCGGHAFATDGYLMGPILEEFRAKKQELIDTLHTMCNDALKSKNKILLEKAPQMKITAQGGIGTVKEDKFLQDYYNLDATGWASPFLLVPEVTNVDEDTLNKLAGATEDDLYLSGVSPLGVPFNNLRSSSSDLARDIRVLQSRPGSACPKGYLVSNTEFTPQPICTASRQYQKLKIDELNRQNLSSLEYQEQFRKIVQKSCICNDLSEGAMIKYALGKNPALQRHTAVCPGPNIAYFSKICTLQDMVDHIYGRTNLLNTAERPNMFIKEIKMYMDYFGKETQKVLGDPTGQQIQYWNTFRKNLLEGIEYYKTLFPKMLEETSEFRDKCLCELEDFRKQLLAFSVFHPALFPEALQPAAA